MNLDSIVKPAKLFNPEPEVHRTNAAPVGSDVDGIIDFTGSPYQWADRLFNVMLGNTWFPEDVDMTGDRKVYMELSDIERSAYDRVLAGLIFNDSAQTSNLASNMMPWITDGAIKACLARQTYEEALHSKSYDVMVKDVSPNRDKIYDLYKTDAMLRERDAFLDKMYSELRYNDEGVPMRAIVKAMLANNVLENIMFYGGFIFFWWLGHKMKGSASMISYIARDERTHVLLFRQMLTSTLKAYPGIDIKVVEQMARELIDGAVNLEIEWALAVTGEEFPEINRETVGRYICGKGDEMLVGLGFEPMYNKPVSPLLAYEKKYDKPNDTRTNFFEDRPKAYSHTTLSTEGYL